MADPPWCGRSATSTTPPMTSPTIWRWILPLYSLQLLPIVCTKFVVRRHGIDGAGAILSQGICKNMGQSTCKALLSSSHGRYAPALIAGHYSPNATQHMSMIRAFKMWRTHSDATIHRWEDGRFNDSTIYQWGKDATIRQCNNLPIEQRMPQPRQFNNLLTREYKSHEMKVEKATSNEG